MAIRFQKRIKVAPGLHLNVGKGGVSGSVGGPGASVNLNKDGLQGTVGATGTGVSYRTKRKRRARADNRVGDTTKIVGAILGLFTLGAIGLFVWADL